MALYKALSALLPTVALASSSKLLGNQLSYCEPRACKDEIVPETIYCRLTFDVVNFTVAGVGNITTRGYQRNDTDRSAATPMGPTINVYPGDNLTIELFNNLDQPLLRQMRARSPDDVALSALQGVRLEPSCPLGLLGE